MYKILEDKIINKNEPYEIMYILKQYKKKYHMTILKILKLCKPYITHKEFYKLLKYYGIR